MRSFPLWRASLLQAFPLVLRAASGIQRWAYMQISSCGLYSQCPLTLNEVGLGGQLSMAPRMQKQTKKIKKCELICKSHSIEPAMAVLLAALLLSLVAAGKVVLFHVVLCCCVAAVPIKGCGLAHAHSVGFHWYCCSQRFTNHSSLRGLEFFMVAGASVQVYQLQQGQVARSWMPFVTRHHISRATSQGCRWRK